MRKKQQKTTTTTAKPRNKGQNRLLVVQRLVRN